MGVGAKELDVLLKLIVLADEGTFAGLLIVDDIKTLQSMRDSAEFISEMIRKHP